MKIRANKELWRRSNEKKIEGEGRGGGVAWQKCNSSATQVQLCPKEEIAELQIAAPVREAAKRRETDESRRGSGKG